MPEYSEVLIYPPPAAPFDDEHWAETVLGKIVAPAVRAHHGSIEWYWFGRYGSADPDKDAKAAGVTESDRHTMQLPDGGTERCVWWVKLRIKEKDADDDDAEDVGRSALEDDVLDRARRLKCKFIPQTNNVMHELRPKRFLGSDSSSTEKKRINLLGAYLQAISELVLDALVDRGDGGWRPEKNTDLDNNPDGSTFPSVIHMVCNTTDVRIPVWLLDNGEVLHKYYAERAVAPQVPRVVSKHAIQG